METPAQTCLRLMVALEELAASEEAAMQTRDFVAAVEIQDRAAPLVEHLAVHGPAVADDSLRARVGTLLRRRARTGEWLAAQIAQAREELQGTRASQHRVARIAPVYGSVRGAGSRQLLAVG
jgi:hypothetical protein